MAGKVVIFGAGVGGLTTAHLLLPYAESIDVYEKNGEAGGLARTEGDDVCYTTEISWRVYFHFYKHVFQLMKEIPSWDGRSVYDHLVKYNNVFVPEINVMGDMSMVQIMRIIKNVCLSKGRIDSYDEYPWRDFIGSDNLEIPQVWINSRVLQHRYS